MKLYIPEIGDRLKLTKDWKFKLFYESRNKSLLEAFGFTFSYRGRGRDEYEEVTLPKGTVIKVDRIYIRQGSMNYSSVSFYAEGVGKGKGSFGKPKNAARFWAKLDDCNNIEYDIETAADRTKPGLWWNVSEVKKSGRTMSRGKLAPTQPFAKEGTILENGDSWSSPGLYKVRISYTEHREFIKKNMYHTILGVPAGYDYEYKITRPDLNYYVIDVHGNEIGNFGSYASMQKAIREHYKST